MKYFSVLLVCLLLVVSQALSQQPVYRFGQVGNNSGYTFYSMDGSTGQVRYMNDFGDQKGIWRSYGGVVRGQGKNNLQFAAVQFENGVVFYAMQSDNGQIYFQPDFGTNPGVWKSYGDPIRAGGRENLILTAEPYQEGTRFSAMDGDTGQIYYMYDLGDDAGKWKPYAGLIK